jgi:hypothetical protein
MTSTNRLSGMMEAYASIIQPISTHGISEESMTGHIRSIREES